jgi:hypothetical protein
MSTLLIPWKKTTINDHVEAIKWSHGNSKYEIYVPVLHCLDVKAKIEQAVTKDARIGSSLF